MTTREELAEIEWWSTSYHESAHAAVRVAYGLPILEMAIRVHRPWFGKPEGAGYVEPGEGPKLRELDDETLAQLAVVSFAGPEAEARWMADYYGESFERARRAAFAAADGDIQNVQTYLKVLNGDRGMADRLEQEAAAMVSDTWDSIVDISEALRENDGYLSGAAVYDIA